MTTDSQPKIEEKPTLSLPEKPADIVGHEWRFSKTTMKWRKYKIQTEEHKAEILKLKQS